MLCVRCSHPLPAGADRCVRCFALNPQNRAAKKDVPKTPEPSGLAPPTSDPELQALRSDVSSDPPQPARIALPSDPPPRPVTASIDSNPPPARAVDDAFDFLPPVTSPGMRVPAPRPPVVEDAGDVDLGNLELTGPQPLLTEDSGTTLQFQSPLPRPAEPSEPPVPLQKGWRLGSQPPQVEPSEGPTVIRDPLSAPILEAEGPRGPLAMTIDEEPSPIAPRRPPARKPDVPWAPAGRRLLAWGVDGTLLVLTAVAHAFLAAWVVGPQRLAPAGFGSPDYWLDLLASRRLLPLWGALLALLAVAYSWLFASVGGRTPGLAVASLKLVRLSGVPVSPAKALARAALSVLSAAPAFFGFFWSLFDPKGQALHDKLTGTAVVRD